MTFKDALTMLYFTAFEILKINIPVVGVTFFELAIGFAIMYILLSFIFGLIRG